MAVFKGSQIGQKPTIHAAITLVTQVIQLIELIHRLEYTSALQHF